MIENLEFIKKYGIGRFLEEEAVKWRCSACGGVICCHNGLCYKCNLDKLRQKNTSTAGRNNEENMAGEIEGQAISS
jgi:hypothetical protein